MKAADLIVRCLENEGVQYVFGLPGEEILDSLDSLADSRIRFVLARHEQGAAFMADAYGRLTGRAGVCLSTLGPGATNLATGVADANLDHAPLVAITGQASRDRVHKESHQYIDIVEHLRPLTKWNTRVETGAVIPEIIRKAFKVAESEKPGACHVEVPEDVAEESADGAALSAERIRRPSPDHSALQTAARLIEAASFPLIFAGNGVIRGQASDELRALARGHGIPVVHTFMAKGSMPYDDDLCLLTAGLQARDYVSYGFEKADLIVAVGYDPVEYAPKFWNPERKKQIVHIDFTPAEVDSYYQPAVEVVADVRKALELLNGLVNADRKVVAVSGDGGFLMNVQELETARRLGLAVVCVVFHDDAYNLTQWKQQTRFGRASGATFSNPDFVELAHAFGAKGYRVTAARDLPPMLAEALAAAGPSIIDVPVDYRENARLTARLGQIVCPI